MRHALFLGIVEVRRLKSTGCKLKFLDGSFLLQDAGKLAGLLDLILSAAFCFSQADVEKLALQSLQKVVFSKLVPGLVLSRLVRLKLAVAQLVCAKLGVATHVVAKLIGAKLDLVNHRSKLVMKMAVPIQVESEKT